MGDTGISGKRYLGYLEFGPTSWLRLFGILSEIDNLLDNQNSDSSTPELPNLDDLF